jgi:chemotaxis protein methyltransferase CheR
VKSDPQLERTIDALLKYATEWSGFTPESVAREAVRRALARELERGETAAEVLRRAASRDPSLVRVLQDAVSVRETYFFRNPQQFELIASRIGGLSVGGVVRAWSAGCATGEEAWSLAATIAANAPERRADPTQMLVVGTDIHEPALDIARAGTYRLSAQRPSGPMLFPVVTTKGDRLVVNEPLRQITSFAPHDLREPPPGEFELIFCRNVLIYFSREAARVVIGRLASALAPGGLLVFGTMDVDPSEMPRLSRVGAPELVTFTTKPTVSERTRRRPTTIRLPPPPAADAAPSVPPQALALHRSALLWVELGGRGSAERVLQELNRTYPDYVPGLLERALSHVRKGDPAGAKSWMRDVLKKLDGLPDDQPVQGLEELPVAFYRATAKTFVDRADKDTQKDKGDKA